MQAVERQKNERKKIEQYHSDLFANKQSIKREDSAQCPLKRAAARASLNFYFPRREGKPKQQVV